MTRFTRNGEVRLAFDDLGGAGGDPLLLVMGLAASRFWWPDGLVGELVGRGFHVVAYDQRDAGESSRFPDTPVANPIGALLGRKEPAYSAEDMTDDAMCVMDAVGWRSAHIFGHSMGGLLAQRTALRHPDRILSLTSSSAVPSDAGLLSLLRYLRPGFLARMSRLKFPAGPDGDLALALAVARMVSSDAYPLDEAQVHAVVAKEEAHSVTSFRDPSAQSRQIGAKWHGGRLAELDLPALVLHGEADQVLRPSAAHATAKAIPGARLATYPGVGHFLPSGIWARYADQIRTTADQARSTTPAP